MYERVHIGSPNGWGSRNAPSYGLSTYGGAWLATDTGSVGIGTNAPSYKLHVSGDSYATGWARAGSGFYVEGMGVHYMAGSVYGIGQIYLTNNEFNWGASNANLYFNYRAAANGTTVTNYIWNAGSSSSYATHKLGSVHIHSNGSSFNESIRIHPSSGGWHAIVLCGSDNTGDSGVTSSTWGIYGNSGAIYINKGASNGQGNPRAMGTSTGWTFGNTDLNSYALNAASFICASWVRTKGATGWYNEDYGGGWYMTEGTYVRTYNSKAVYVPNTGDHAVYTAGGFASERASGSLFKTYYGSTWYNTIYNHGNGNLSIDAPSGSLYLAYYNGSVYFCGSTYRLERSTGKMYAAAFYETSDRNLKENIQILSTDLLDKVYNIKEVSFNWKKNGEKAFGYIA